MQTRVIFIGGGNMAEAIFSRLDPLKLSLVVIDRNVERHAQLKTKYPHIKFMQQLNFDSQAEDIVLLAVKPQDAKAACLELKPLIQKSNIVSVMAGVTTNSLSNWFNTTRLVRTMPNTPGMIGLGITGIYFSPAVGPAEHNLITEIFNGIGKTFIFNNEDQIDRITAVGSSSPAYVYYFAESLIDAAVDKMGFSPQDAREITIQVLKGSLAMIENHPDITIAQLRTNVTSKKGTTEAALNILEHAGMKETIKDAEDACYNRARELGALFI